MAAGFVKGFEGQTGDSLLRAFAYPGSVIGDDDVRTQGSNRSDHPAKRFIVTPRAQDFVGCPRVSDVAKV